MSPRRVLAVAVKDVKGTLRDRSAVFWVFVFPILLLTMFEVLFGGGHEFHANVGVVTGGSEIAGAFVKGLKKSKELHVKTLPDEREALRALKRGDLDAVIVFPRGFDRAVREGKRPRVKVYVDHTDPQEYTAVRGAVTGALEVLRERIRAEMRREIPAPYVEFVEAYTHPFRVDVHGVTRAVKKGFFVLAFIGVQLLFAASITAAMLTLDELRTGTLRRLATTPVSPWEFLAGKYLATTLIVVLSVLLGLAYSRVAFGVRYFPSAEGWGLVLLGTVASTGVGVLVALVSREEKIASAVLNVIAFPAMFLGAVVVPENLVPEVALDVFHWYPPVTFVHALRAADLYGKPVATADAVVGVVLTAVIFAASVLTFRWAARPRGIVSRLITIEGDRRGR